MIRILLFFYLVSPYKFHLSITCSLSIQFKQTLPVTLIIITIFGLEIGIKKKLWGEEEEVGIHRMFHLVVSNIPVFQ